MTPFGHMTGDGTLRGHAGAVSVVFSVCLAWAGLILVVVPLVIFYAVTSDVLGYFADLYRRELTTHEP